MSLNQSNKLLSVCFISLLLAACQQPLLPEQVAEKFWFAVKANNADQIQQYSNVFWQTEMDTLKAVPEFESFTLSTITIQDNTAEIDTTLINKDTSRPIEFTSYLIRTDTIWKVNFNKTINSIDPNDPADVIAELSELGELLSDELNESIDELHKALPKIEEELSEFEEKLQEEIPVIRQKIDDLLKNLEELLSKPNEEAPSSETTEI